MSIAPDFLLPATAHEVIRTGFAYWQSAKPGLDLFPGRQHIEPRAIPRLLPYTWLIEIHPPAAGSYVPRFRFRLIGSHVDLGYGEPKTGRWINDIEPNFDRDPGIHAPMVEVAREGRPNYRRGTPRFTFNQRATELERLLLPLAGDGRTIDMLFGFTIFYGSDGEELQTAF